jgi:putative toxin-antitoxin system antitoxin component (TIGR02293 family)
MKQKPKQDRPQNVSEPMAVYGLRPGKGPRQRMGAGEIVGRIREGLPVAEFDALCDLLALSGEALSGHLGISRSTLARRRATGRLDMQESDRLLRFARLFERACVVLQDAQTAREWLAAPARALDFATPLVFAETEAGAREVENLLGRIETGVYS